MENQNDPDELVQVPRWQLEKIDDALRMVVNAYDCKYRKTCCDRTTMLAYNMTRQLLERGEYEYKTEHMLGYGQMPK